MKRVSERTLHLVFAVSLWVKAFFALIEIIGGIAAWMVSREFLLQLVISLTREELAEDPRDIIANYLRHTARNLSIGAKTFAAIYLLTHGLIKLWLVTGLLLERFLYYPATIAVFMTFVIYQLYRFTLCHSALLLAITALDILIITLT